MLAVGLNRKGLRVSVKRFLKNGRSKSLLDFYLVYNHVYLKIMR